MTEHKQSKIINQKSKNVFQAVLATGLHLFPFRTEKLNLSAPMVLHRGRVGRRRKFIPFIKNGEGFFCGGEKNMYFCGRVSKSILK